MWLESLLPIFDRPTKPYILGLFQETHYLWSLSKALRLVKTRHFLDRNKVPSSSKPKSGDGSDRPPSLLNKMGLAKIQYPILQLIEKNHYLSSSRKPITLAKQNPSFQQNWALQLFRPKKFLQGRLSGSLMKKPRTGISADYEESHHPKQLSRSAELLLLRTKLKKPRTPIQYIDPST